MAASTELALERLQQQVSSGSVKISAACSRIDNIIQTLSKDELTRPFLLVFPRILALVFGDEENVGWLEQVTDEDSMHSLWHLLKPNGILFTSCLSHAALDYSSPYELPSSQFPIPLQKQLKKNGLSSFPIPLDSCIVNVVREGSPPLYVMRLDASELFVYRLLIYLLWVRKHGLATSGSSSKLSRSFSSTHFARFHSFESLSLKLGGEKSFRFQDERPARLYQKVLQGYLNYFMPVAGSVSSKDETIFAHKYLKSTSGTWLGWKLASFFFTGINEFWLHQFEYRIEPSSSRIESEPTFSLPSVDFFEAVQIVTKHLITAVCYPTRPDLPVQLQKYYDQLVDSSFVSFRVRLYRLLRLSLAMCPSDNSITVVGSLWLDFIAPWRYLTIGTDRSQSTMAWRQWVTNNYFFYHTLLGALLDYVEVVTEGFGEALIKVGAHVDVETIGKSLLPVLLLLARILASVSPFSDLINEIETENLSTKQQNILSSPSWIHKPPTSASSNVGVKEQLSALESEKFCLVPLFDGDSQQRSLRILFWLERVHSSLPSDHPPAGNIADMQHLASPSGDFDLKSLIVQSEEEICSIFGIKEEDFESFSTRFEEGRRMEALLPSDSSTSRMRRKYIPTSSPDKIATLKKMHLEKTKECDRHVRSYESAYLVALMFWISSILNEYYEMLINYVGEKSQNTFAIPSRIKKYRFNLRFLAAYPNIIFILAAYTLLRLLTWLVLS